MQQDWPFDKGPDHAALTTRQVIEDGYPILLVSHYADDHSWAFICGTTSVTEDGRVIGMEEAIKLDLSLLEIADLPPGWQAWRKEAGGAWHRERAE